MKRRYGRFIGGTHFDYVKKNLKDTTSSMSPRATVEQLEALKKLGLDFQENEISKVRAKALIKEAKEKGLISKASQGNLDQ